LNSTLICGGQQVIAFGLAFVLPFSRAKVWKGALFTREEAVQVSKPFPCPSTYLIQTDACFILFIRSYPSHIIALKQLTQVKLKGYVAGANGIKRVWRFEGIGVVTQLILPRAE
jgi:hypothetical protein